VYCDGRLLCAIIVVGVFHEVRIIHYFEEQFSQRATNNHARQEETGGDGGTVSRDRQAVPDQHEDEKIVEVLSDINVQDVPDDFTFGGPEESGILIEVVFLAPSLVDRIGSNSIAYLLAIVAVIVLQEEGSDEEDDGRATRPDGCLENFAAISLQALLPACIDSEIDVDEESTHRATDHTQDDCRQQALSVADVIAVGCAELGS
jgi:hypothetical protein